MHIFLHHKFYNKGLAYIQANAVFICILWGPPVLYMLLLIVDGSQQICKFDAHREWFIH